MSLRRAAAKLGIAGLILGASLLALEYWLLPNHAATFVLVSDAEVSEVTLSFERDPPLHAYRSTQADRIFAWDTIVARGTRPTPFVEVSWRGPDGRRHSVRQVVVNDDDGTRCVHAIRLNSSGEAVPFGVHSGGGPLLIVSRCR